jgi:hypothetical protein
MASRIATNGLPSGMTASEVKMVLTDGLRARTACSAAGGSSLKLIRKSHPS